MTAHKQQAKIYFPNLDGIRFFCFLSVFFYHSFYTEHDYIINNPIYDFIKRTLFSNGDLGVNFFFVLSGFLITYLLIKEKMLNGQVSIGNFYIRRVLRIWPLFYFCVFFGFFIFPQLKIMFGGQPSESAHLPYYLTFTNNFDFIQNGLPDASILGVLWSIAVEEQFYLIWPLIIFITPVKKMWIAFSAILLTSFTFRAFNDSYPMHQFHTLSCIGDMTVGAIASWLIIHSSKFKTAIENLHRRWIVLIYLAFLLCFLFRFEFLMTTHFSRIFERSLIALLAALIILEQSFSRNSFYKMSRFKRLSKLGVISYGLYCFHLIGILITITITRLLGINDQLWQVIVLEFILSLSITILISSLSYKYFEGLFLRLKDRFAFIVKADAEDPVAPGIPAGEYSKR